VRFVPAVMLLGAALAAHAAGPAPNSPTSPAANPAPAADDATLCQWDSPVGTHGRRCAIDVERVDRRAACHYDQATTPDMTDHPPMLFSVSRGEHMVFSSSRNRSFRVRRLVPITATGASGQACPKHPFKHEFHEEDFTFGDGYDSLVAKKAAIGCRYKLEVQFLTLDPDAPVATHDPHHRHLECRDPHLQVQQ